VRRRSARSTDTRGASDDTGQAVLAQEAVRLRALLREARAATAAEARGQARSEIRVWSAIAIVVALIIGGVIGHFGFTDPAVTLLEEPKRAPALQIVQDEASAIAPPDTLRVYISGAVAEAQVVEAPAGSLVADALELAGGAASDADLDAVNLAAPVRDNQHIVVPRLTERVTTREDESALAPLIDINTAPSEELMTLPEIGQTRAADIVSYRAANGPFERIEDIVDVPGIGPGILEQITHLITVED